LNFYHPDYREKEEGATLRYASKIPRMANGRLKNSVYKSIPRGMPLRLREGVFRQLDDRDWLFNKLENETVFLIHESRAYGIAVKISDIDWAGA
jgi:hypothetical protein